MSLLCNNQEKKTKGLTRRQFLKTAGGTIALAATFPMLSLTAQGQGNVTQKAAMKRIDFENHFYDKTIFTVLQKRTTPPYYREDIGIVTWANNIPDNLDNCNFKENLLDLGEGRLQSMDKAGIDLAVISCSSGVEFLDVSESVEVARKTNDKLFEATKKYPKRFMGSAILPVKDVKAACRELERCVKELGFVCWHTHSNFGKNAAPDDEIFRPIFKKAANLGVYVYLHPAFPEHPRLEGYSAALIRYTSALTKKYGSGMGFTADTSRTISRMIFSGLFDEMPELTLVLGHIGETFPSLLERIDNRAALHSTPLLKNKYEPSYYFKNNILVTTSGNTSQEAFYYTRDMLGIDRILFASDHPFEFIADMASAIDNIPLSEEERAAVYYKNAAEKLNIQLP